MAQVVEIFPEGPKTKAYLFCIVNMMAADVLAMPGARASATIIFTTLNRINSVPHVKGKVALDFNDSMKLLHTNDIIHNGPQNP